MSHVLMSTAAAHGHVPPDLPVMAELVSRGHRVTYPIPDRFADAVASTGATVLPIHTDLPDPARGGAVARRGCGGHALSRVHHLPRVELAPHMVAWDTF